MLFKRRVPNAISQLLIRQTLTGNDFLSRYLHIWRLKSNREYNAQESCFKLPFKQINNTNLYWRRIMSIFPKNVEQISPNNHNLKISTENHKGRSKQCDESLFIAQMSSLLPSVTCHEDRSRSISCIGWVVNLLPVGTTSCQQWDGQQ